MSKSNDTTQVTSGAHGIWRLDAIVDQFRDASLGQLLLFVLFIILVTRMIIPTFDEVKAPFVGYRSILEPTFLVRLRFSKGALPQIADGYHKFHDSMFKVRRSDKDVLVISNKYVDELRNLPQEKLSLTEALYENMVGDYTALDITLEGNLLTRILQSKVTPNLPYFTEIMKKEIDLALPQIVPECSDRWAEVNIYEIILNLVARLTNRILLAEPDCYDKEWAESSMRFSESVTMTTMVLRLFPNWLRPAVAFVLPSARNVQSNLQRAKSAMIPIINRRRQFEKNDPKFQKPNDFLQWMMDVADEREARPEKLAHRQLQMVLGSAHTTTMTGTHAMYDLCAMPEYIDPLREEITNCIKDSGWDKTTPNRMQKMDSFLRESQRLNPASLLGFHRIVRNPLTLSSGIHLPPSTHLCTASYNISQALSFAPNAADFDGFRYFRKRQQSADDANKHQFAMTDIHHLHFGHGIHACPGRALASTELKLIVGCLIERYEFRLPEGKGRPKTLNADEFLYPDPTARLLMRERNLG